jgi:hypothetical protein
MTEREAFAWAIGALVDAAGDLPPSIVAVDDVRDTARRTQAWCQRCRDGKVIPRN